MVHFLAKSKEAEQMLRVLKRASLGKHNFPEVLECEIQQRQIAIVTSWVWGEPLARRLERASTREHLWPGPRCAIRLIRGVAHTIHYLNKSLNVIHGDIHPGNLILVRDPNRLIVTDFGSAWVVEDGVYRFAGDGRTDGYAAPEQHLKRKRVDFRADLFSVSVLGYVLLTAELPYERVGGKAALPELRPTFERRWVPPSAKCVQSETVSREIWKLIDAVIGRGLKLDPERRYAETDSWIADLNEIDARIRLRPATGSVTRAMLSVMKFVHGLLGTDGHRRACPPDKGHGVWQ